MVLEMRRGIRKYSINVDERIVYVSGNSGRGKTVFVDGLRYILDNIRTTRLDKLEDINNATGDYIYCDIPINTPRDISDIENFYRVDNKTWMIADEDFSDIGKPYLTDILRALNIDFLFISRDYNLCKLAFELGALYEIRMDIDEIIRLYSKG